MNTAVEKFVLGEGREVGRSVGKLGAGTARGTICW